jgi:hypothetical protein
MSQVNTGPATLELTAEQIQEWRRASQQAEKADPELRRWRERWHADMNAAYARRLRDPAKAPRYIITR